MNVIPSSSAQLLPSWRWTGVVFRNWIHVWFIILICIISPLEHLLGTIVSYRNCVLQQIDADITTLWSSNCLRRRRLRNFHEISVSDIFRLTQTAI